MLKKIGALSLLLTILLIPEYAIPQTARPKLLIGLIPEMNVFKQKERFSLLGEYLSKKTGADIQFTILSRYGNIIERFTTEKMDGAFFGSFTGALAIQKLGVVPIARPVNPDQTSTYRGYLFVRRDSGIRTIADMKGKKMAFVEKATTAGYLFPLAYLRENGITDPPHFFREHFFAGSHDAAIYAVLNRKADVGAAKHSMYRRMMKENPRIEKELVIVAESPNVPSNGLCVRKGLNPEIIKKLKSALLNLHENREGEAVLQKFGALRFIDTSERDYDPVFKMAQNAGIDIKHYDYSNK